MTAKPQPSQVIPQMSVLSEEQITRVHDDALKILAEIGVRVDSQAAVKVFAKSGGTTVKDENYVLISKELVEWAIEAAPDEIAVYDRTGDRAFTLGDGEVRFGIGVTNLYYQEPGTHALVRFSREHMAKMVRLGNELSQFDVVSTVGIIQDYPPEAADLYAVLEMLANTTKPLVVLVSEEKLFPQVLGLCEKLTGDLSERPSIMPYFNPISPLIINAGTSDKMIEAIKQGLPIIYSNYGMAGMSTPITPAGTLALLTAELLAGLVLGQLIREGAPMVLGSLPAFFNMKKMKDYDDPLTYLLNLACAEMMAHYHIPHAGTSGSGIGWTPDMQAGGASWLNHVTSISGKAGLVPFVGSNHASLAFSPANAVYANEVIAQARRFARGFTYDDDHVGLADLIEAGPGGSFIAADLTLKHLRKQHFESGLFPIMGLDKWEQEGMPRAEKVLIEKTQQMLAELKAPDDYAALIEKGERFIKWM